MEEMKNFSKVSFDLDWESLKRIDQANKSFGISVPFYPFYPKPSVLFSCVPFLFHLSFDLFSQGKYLSV